MKTRRLMLTATALAAWAATGLQPVLAQSPGAGQPMKIIVATPAGGASDTAARLVAQHLAKSLGQPVVVENKPGGNGVPAVQATLTAAPDGQTLLWAMASMAGMPMLVKSAPIKSLGEFTPVTQVVHLAYGLFVNPQVPASTVAELSAYIKANPDRLSYGTGVLSEYMVSVHYLRAAGLKAVRVPYKGGAQLLPDLISGQLQFTIGALAPVLPHVKSGKLRLLATLPERNTILPGVPSMAEAGVPMEQMPAWNGLVAPPGTPKEVANRIAQEVNRALADPAVRATLESQGFRVAGGTPQQMGEAIESATSVWRQFIRDYDIPQE